MGNRMILSLLREDSKWLLAVVMFLGMAACQPGNVCSAESENAVMEETARNTEMLLTDFAEVLSKATYARREVREFLREEALKQFDRNYDVLYALARDKKVGDETFRDILVAYSSEEEMDRIETGLPLLNIFVPEISCFSICPENLDCEDAEIPVAVSKARVTSLYVNGVCEADLGKGEVPDFHTFVVNENSRVAVVPATKGGKSAVSFISPNYDGTQTATLTRAVAAPAATVGEKAMEAFRYFNQNASSKNSRNLQRDYIYYGMTPDSEEGVLQGWVSEYVHFIEVDPKAYFRMADQREGEIYDDPHIKKESVSRKKKDFTPEELVDRMWTRGVYNIRVNVFPDQEVYYIPLMASEIWNFNYERDYQHGTWFRKKKYTYKINPDKFTSKRIYLNPEELSFRAWNLSRESLCRYLVFSEADKSSLCTYLVDFDMPKMALHKVADGVKFGLGTGEDLSSVSTDISTPATVPYSRLYLLDGYEEDDMLGVGRIYFYDPIVDSKNGENYLPYIYDAGLVKFGIAVK